ncbi:1-hydroxycarotenoid 3,4-desaturase CrtD [Sphingomonas astaxanthinifaciens]|uniref:Phytoene desaturase n=1 Tax=Sphingomonas astaxanthinifaciens DSM 22298 TaxID=1123267 RepID=A0ABQ5Z6W3_9SPHN|nr:1-hydroxycarotenoid 3,4-desaturase CrtD [Sphingomonas astaxanthinifaciens]GLR47732.1 phytoene desaturase [Sphingomonas astaxanthinifaciens DSM 22298]
MRDEVVVIGAGIGGLTSALLLAVQGLRVTVVDKERQAGGKVRQLAVGGVPVDAGPTVFTMKPLFDEIFAAAGARLEERCTVRRADLLARHAWSEHERLDLFDDPARSEAAIGDFAGADAARGYRDFRVEAQRIHDILDAPFLRNSRVYPPMLMWRIGLWRLGALRAIRPYESLWNALGDHFRDPRLRQLFARYSTYCGSSPFDAPATLMLITHVEAMGVWLIDGGLTALAEALEALAREHGVVFRFGEEVREVLVEHGRAAGVRLASGESLRAGAVIANCDPAALASGRVRTGDVAAVGKVPPRRRSLSAMVWLMKAEADGFPLDRHNVFFSPDYRAEFDALRRGRLPDRPTAYVCALDRPDGPVVAGDRLQIIVNAPANGDTHAYGPEEIARCGTAMEERLAACGLRLRPLAPPRVTTPRDFEALLPSTGGALYGRASHGWAASFLRQSARTRIPGLYCAGGSTHPGAGVPMAALSGQLAVTTLLRDRSSIVRSGRAAMPGGMSMRSPTAVPSG